MIPDYIAIDVETGGLYPSIHALLCISARTSWESKPFLVYLWPLEGKCVDPAAAAKNGYSAEKWMARGARTAVEGMTWLVDWLTLRLDEKPGAVMLAHNAGFDRGFLEETGRLTGITRLPGRHSWRCSMNTFGIAQDLGLAPKGSASLETLGNLLGLWPQAGRPAVHEAEEDTEVCLRGQLELMLRFVNAIQFNSEKKEAA